MILNKLRKSLKPVNFVLEVFLYLLYLFFCMRLWLNGPQAFSSSSICLAALADIVTLLNYNGSKKIEHNAQAGVDEEVFHALSPVSVADFLE